MPANQPTLPIGDAYPTTAPPEPFVAIDGTHYESTTPTLFE